MDFTASHLSVGERCSVLQIFGVGESTVSHKAEYALTAVSFWEQWKTNLLQGGQHSVDYHGWILLIAVFTVIAVIRRRAVDSKRIFRSLAISCGCIVFIATRPHCGTAGSV